jgi:hypothetical protein
MRFIAPLSRSVQLSRPATTARTPSASSWWICRRCISSALPRRLPQTIVQTGPRTKTRRRGILLAVAGAGVVGTSAVGWKDGEHYVHAAERALRVAKALALNIQESATPPRGFREEEHNG